MNVTKTCAHTHGHAQGSGLNQLNVDATYVIYVQQFTTEVQSPLVYTITVLNSLHTDCQHN